jgi:hypothetical protein
VIEAPIRANFEETFQALPEKQRRVGRRQCKVFGRTHPEAVKGLKPHYRMTHAKDDLGLGKVFSVNI